MGLASVYDIVAGHKIAHKCDINVLHELSSGVKSTLIYLVDMFDGKTALAFSTHLLEQSFVEVSTALGIKDNVGVFVSKNICDEAGLDYQTFYSSFYFTTNLGTEFHYNIYWHSGVYRKDLEGVGRHLPFYIRDLLPSFSQTIIDLAKIKVEEAHRGKGVGTKDLQAFLDMFHGVPIVGTAGILDEMYDKLEADGTLFEYLDNLVVFYEKRGWLNVNDLFGCGETHITICNSNGSKTFEDKLRKIRNREQ